MKRDFPGQLLCLSLILWPPLRSESRQQRPGRQGLTSSSAGSLVLLHCCLIARNHSSERFSNLPRVTQPDLESHGSARIFQDSSQRPSRCSRLSCMLVFSQSSGTARVQLSGHGPSQPSKPGQKENSSGLTHGTFHKPSPVQSAPHVLTLPNKHSK